MKDISKIYRKIRNADSWEKRFLIVEQLPPFVAKQVLLKMVANPTITKQ